MYIDSKALFVLYFGVFILPSFFITMRYSLHLQDTTGLEVLEWRALVPRHGLVSTVSVSLLSYCIPPDSAGVLINVAVVCVCVPSWLGGAVYNYVTVVIIFHFSTIFCVIVWDSSC